MMAFKIFRSFFILSVAFSAISAAQAQDASIVGELERLRRDMNTLQSFVFRGDKQGAPPVNSGAYPEFASQDSVSQIQLQMQGLRRQMREMNGQFEEIQFKISRTAERLDRLVADVDLRLQALEGGQPVTRRPEAGAGATLGSSVPTPSTTVISSAGTAPAGAAAKTANGLQPGQKAFGVISKRDLNKFRETGAVEASTKPPVATPSSTAAQKPASLSRSQPSAAPSPPPVTTASRVASAQPANAPAALPAGTPKQQYEHAYNLLMKRELPEAESALKAFLEQHPKHELADNAIFWLGETYYARKNYQEAIRVYYDAYKAYPKGNKAPAVLLKLGMSLATIGEKESACSAYDELSSSHPKANARILSSAARSKKSLGCK